MSNYRVAHRYAVALLQSAEEEHQLEATAGDVEMIGKTVRENRELKLLLASPVIEKKKKKGILTELFKGRIGPVTWKFLDLLTEKEREPQLLDILDEFGRLLDEKRGIVRIQVTGAVELTEAQKNRLRDELERYTKKKVIPAFNLDPSILGGFVVRLDDRVIDASVARQLELLRERFLQGSYVEEGSYRTRN